MGSPLAGAGQGLRFSPGPLSTHAHYTYTSTLFSVDFGDQGGSPWYIMPTRGRAVSDPYARLHAWFLVSYDLRLKKCLTNIFPYLSLVHSGRS